ncbi:hypothetical protein BDP27DRAFT_1242425 [Rhodocollybia butyracea]|uniref:Uncharacterized protein n=1 Tax=Rhodocollybia butyracea TaxID=206335 RepID=A0A9P5P9E9_9AGAR|nr:hypothetical protein BDP27DRAFT_1242425 [Rhodocollybia butyracea]
MHATEFFAITGSPARAFARILFVTRYLFQFPASRTYISSGYAAARYGPRWAYKPWLFFDLQGLEKIEEIINYGADEEVLGLRRSYIDSFNMVAIVGALLAQLAVSSLSLPGLNQTTYFSRGALILSMAVGLLAVFFTCVQQRALGFLQRPVEVRAWLSNGVYYTNQKGDETFQSSYISHLFLQLPYELMGISISLYLGSIGIYLGSAYVQRVPLTLGVDGESVGNLGVLFAFIVCTTFPLLVFSQLLGGKEMESEKCAEEMRLHAFGSGIYREKATTMLNATEGMTRIQ